ncbi:MAG: PIN domain-containing protein [Verrucomicrobiota bacterium]|jgi:hypothetical protein|nr:PIN domain-containing protein [Verrucomicrobiota bacterium]
MTFLVDANVLSEPTKPRFERRVIDWLAKNDAEIVVDPVVMGEIWEGIVALDAGKKQSDLMQWFTELRANVQCLDWTLDTAIAWAELRDDVRRRGFTVPVKDTLIAATAKAHGLTVATRNVDDFVRCGVPVLNPFV